VYSISPLGLCTYLTHLIYVFSQPISQLKDSVEGVKLGMSDRISQIMQRDGLDEEGTFIWLTVRSNVHD
jgi:hypothetical protein